MSKCNKVKHRIECVHCNYSLSEAQYPDDYDSDNGGLSCNISDEQVEEHIEYVKSLISDEKNHFWDCKCLIHR